MSFRVKRPEGRKMRKFFLFSCLVFLFAGCSKREVNVNIGPDFFSQRPRVYAVLPFDNHEGKETAGKILRDSFESAFLQTGFRVVERNQLDRLLEEMSFSASGLTEEDRLRLGEILNADALILGTVTAFDKGSLGSSYPMVGISVRAVDVKTGIILWSGNSQRIAFDFNKEPEALIHETTKIFVDDLVKKSRSGKW